MKACRTASIVAAVPFGILLGMGACRNERQPTEIPPLTTAKPQSGGRIDPNAVAIPATGSHPAIAIAGEAAPVDPGAAPKVAFVDAAFKLDDDFCAVVVVAVLKGKLTYANETVGEGDMLVVSAPKASEVKLTGLAVKATTSRDCLAIQKPPTESKVVRGAAAQKLTFAGGKMNAWLDFDSNSLPPRDRAVQHFYFGRLEGTAPVAEHTHPTSWEVLAAVEAAGTFTLDGRASRLAPRQVVVVPPGTKHAWAPDPGSKLVAFQVYSPPGPEQRFIGLAAAEKDAGKP